MISIDSSQTTNQNNPNSTDDSSNAVEIEEIDPELTLIIQKEVECISRILLLTMYGNKKEGYTSKQFLQQSMENMVLLIQRWSDNGMIHGIVCKNGNTKREDYGNEDKIED